MGAWLRRIRGRGPHGWCCVKHTPGPWAVDSDGAGWYIEATPERGHSLAFIASPEFQEEPDTSASEAEANASLIAAAPDLLEALNEMTRLALGPTGGCSAAEKRNAIEASIAAIAKATGEGE